MKKTIKSIRSLSVITSSLIAGDISVELNPVMEEFVSGKRIIVNAIIEDEVKLDVVRTYFKSADAQYYSFVAMDCDLGSCTGTLPAPSATTSAIDYLVLVKNSEDKVYKTQTFTAESLPSGSEIPKYQVDPASDIIQVKTELAKAPKVVTGFTDNIALDTVESTVKYGAVVGLSSGGSTGASGAAVATGTSSAGTVAASSALAMSTTAIVATSVAVVGGAAAASGGGSSGGSLSSSSHSDDHSDDSYSDETCPAGTVDLRGTWTYSDSHENCQNSSSGTSTFSYNGTNYSSVYSGEYLRYEDCTTHGESGTEVFIATGICVTQDEYNNGGVDKDSDVVVIETYTTNKIVEILENGKVVTFTR